MGEENGGVSGLDLPARWTLVPLRGTIYRVYLLGPSTVDAGPIKGEPYIGSIW